MSEKNKATEKNSWEWWGGGAQEVRIQPGEHRAEGRGQRVENIRGVPRQGIKKEMARNAFKRCAWKGKKESEWKLEEPEVWKRWPWLLLSR